MKTKTVGIILLSVIAVAATGFVASILLNERDARVPRLDPRLENRLAQVQDGMKELEVDTLFTGFETWKAQELTDRFGDGRPLLRQATHNTVYFDKHDADYDCFVVVYFDYFGLVVGKDVGVWQR